MTRPIFDTAAFWTGLTSDQQRAIGVAAIDREIAIHGRDEIEAPEGTDFDELDVAADDALLTAVFDVLDLASIDEDEFPLPSFAAQPGAVG